MKLLECRMMGGRCLASLMAGLNLLVLFQSDVLASRNTEKASRTALLRQATGTERTGDVSNPGYRTYVEGMLNVNSDAAAKVTNDAYAVVPTSSKPREDLYVTDLKKDFGGQNSVSGMIKSQVEPDRLSGQVKDSRSRATEEVYQMERLKQVKAYEEQQKKVETNALSMRSSVEADKMNPQRESKTGLRPSLANNPFYFSETGQLSFAEMRPLIANRMVQLGYTRLEAENLIGNTSNPEEALLMLMQKENFSYGDAVDLVGITPQASQESQDES